MVTNLAYFYETSRKVRGGKWVWVKDSNGEQRGNVLLGGTILNPRKGFDHLYAAQLVQYTPGEGCLIFRSFKVLYTEELSGDDGGTFILIPADGYSDVPEVGQSLMAAPQTATGTGDAATVVSVEQQSDSTYGEVFAIELGAKKLGIQVGDILVEAKYDKTASKYSPLVPNPNTFVEADCDLMPTEGYGLTGEANYSISTVYNKQAWIARMQPLPNYVLAKNRSYIDGIFWI